MPLLSIIIPTYNRPALLKTAIQSVLAQTNDNWELIIIDDGSNPKANVVIKEFNDSRITYFYQENKGRSIARNKGISLAQGKYIAFLDDDDVYDKNFCAAVSEEEEGEDVIVFAYKMKNMGANDYVIYQPEESNNFLKLFATRTYAPSGFVIKRAAIGTSRFLKNAFLGEDFQFFMSFCLNKKIKTVNHISSIMRSHPNNTTNSKYSKFKKQVYPQLKENVIDLIGQNKRKIGITGEEFLAIRDSHLNSLLKGHANHDLSFTKNLIETIKKDYPDYKALTTLDLIVQRSKGIIKSMLS